MGLPLQGVRVVNRGCNDGGSWFSRSGFRCGRVMTRRVATRFEGTGRVQGVSRASAHSSAIPQQG